MKNNLSNLVITKVYSTNRLYTSDTRILSRRNNRERWAFIIKLKGKTVYTANNTTYFSDATHPIILPKGCSYTWECLEQGEYYVIEFEANFSDSQLYSFHIPENNTILKAFTQIENALSFSTEYAQMECMRELYDLLIFLISSYKNAYVPPAKLQLLKPALDYMTNHYSDANITNDFLAQLCDVSTIYFRKVFFSQYQVPPIKYLQNLRMEKAKNMLTSDYESISQVAESVGYNSIYHFSKMFKTCTGMSPSEYTSCFHAENTF